MAWQIFLTCVVMFIVVIIIVEQLDSANIVCRLICIVFFYTSLIGIPASIIAIIWGY